MVSTMVSVGGKVATDPVMSALPTPTRYCEGSSAASSACLGRKRCECACLVLSRAERACERPMLGKRRLATSWLTIRTTKREAPRATRAWERAIGGAGRGGGLGGRAAAGPACTCMSRAPRDGLQLASFQGWCPGTQAQAWATRYGIGRSTPRVVLAEGVLSLQWQRLARPCRRPGGVGRA